MTHPIRAKPAPTKKCIPGMSGRTDLMDDTTVDLDDEDDDEGRDVAKVARMVAYMDDPIAPVSSVMEPTAPRRAPDCPGEERLAKRACKAGIDTVLFCFAKGYLLGKKRKGKKKSKLRSVPFHQQGIM